MSDLRICRWHLSPSGCRYGMNCKFSHSDQASGPGGRGWRRNESNVSRKALDLSPLPSTTENELRTWRRLLSQLAPTCAHIPDLVRLAILFQTGASLVASDASSRQEVLRDLASERGLCLINALIDHGQSSGYSTNHAMGSQYFRERFKPLCDCLTHPDVLCSFILERYSDEIFVFLYGSRGTRGGKFLSAITTSMERAVEENSTIADTAVKHNTSVLATYESALAVTLHIVESSTVATIQPDIVALVNRLAEVVELAINAEGFAHGTASLKVMTRLQERLGIGHSIAELSSTFQHKTLPNPKYEVNQDPPGILSASGARHDNDFADITEISILPTASEIRSGRSEYLPTLNPASWHIQGIGGLIDRHFRLLREDTVGQLRDAIRVHIESKDGSQAQGHPYAGKKQLVRICLYDDVEIERQLVDNYHGVCFEISFEQHRSVRDMTQDKRKAWWLRTRRLQPDALVCVTNGSRFLLFCSVFEERESISSRKKDATGVRPKTRRPDLSTSSERAYLSLKLCDERQTDIRKFLSLNRKRRRMSLIEFPGILLPAFRHTLEALQNMSKASDVPFANFLAPIDPNDPSVGDPGLPLYAQQPGFSYPLTSIMNDGTRPSWPASRPGDMEGLKSRTSLDAAQVEAVINTLTRSLAFIQGPPGTGKSYTGVAIIRLLLDCRQSANLGPILCVCYTNHALDQLLEQLIANGVQQIIRVGSRSKSEALSGLLLNEVVKQMPRTGQEKQREWELRTLLESDKKRIDELLAACLDIEPHKRVIAYLAEHEADYHSAIFSRFDEEGFQKVDTDKRKILEAWRHGGLRYRHGKPPPVSQIPPEDLLNLPHVVRMNLYNHWLTESESCLRETLARSIAEYSKCRAEYAQIQQEVKLRCLQAAHIIGITTTGLARNLELLRRVRSKVLICEEAGEVLEAHMLTALVPSVEHAIFIGDHLQLRPQIQRYDLSSEHVHGSQYSLDMSLFERLVKPPNDAAVKLPLSTLSTQRRMHPLISRLVRHTLYPDLIDDPSVNRYPRVVGMKQRLQWFDHEKWENDNTTAVGANTSHTNSFEITMTAALASHLIRQGVYKPNEIAVLTPYLGQLHELRKLLGTMYELVLTDHDQDALVGAGLDLSDTPNPPPESPVENTPSVHKSSALHALKVATIDNFQGEEAKVVIISLVRSNPQNKCGFLRTFNRINVLLSRAQHGMYILGNSRTAGSTQMWHDVIGMLEQDDLVKPDLELECSRHPHDVIKVRSPDDFQQLSPEGGCRRRCADRLACGHACVSRCHSVALHSVAKCLEPCPRTMKGCSHSCPRSCGDPCPEACRVDVTDADRILPCGHSQVHLPCWQSQNPSRYNCQRDVQRIVPGCGHEVTLPCHVDYEHEKYFCTAVCGASLSCGHICQRVCGSCRRRSNGEIQSEDHKACLQKCGRDYTTCSHRCIKECHGTLLCGLCDLPCEVSCIHSKCSRKCNEPCIPCAEQVCASQCSHSRCSMPCAAPCDWIPCHLRCTKLLECGHQCPSLCGEVCPDKKFCQICCDHDVRDQVVDLFEMKTFGEIDLDEDPCIIPYCGHVATVSSMDGQMEMRKHYRYAEDAIVSVNTSVPFSNENETTKTCPSCRGSLRNIARYGRIVRRALLDESSKKFILWSNQNGSLYADKFHELQKGLVESVQSQEPRILRPIKFQVEISTLRLRSASRALNIPTRYDKIFSLRNQLVRFSTDVHTQEQPYNRVWELCEDARRRRGIETTFTVDSSVLQIGCYLHASALLLRCELAIASDLITIATQRVRKDAIEEIKIDMSNAKARSLQLVKEAIGAQRPSHEVEGYMFLARCAALERPAADAKSSEALRNEAMRHLESARHVCEQNPGSTLGMMEEIETIERAVIGEFYSVVTSEERMQVLRAMATEFSGTGHWYYCHNGHPFTIGECGGPMQETRCPECGAPVGGQHHRAAEGVRRANDLEGELRDLQL